VSDCEGETGINEAQPADSVRLSAQEVNYWLRIEMKQGVVIERFGSMLCSDTAPPRRCTR
jgi:hypothetical protein